MIQKEIGGFDSIIIAKDLGDLPCGAALQVADYREPVINAGHLLIKDKTTQEVKPLGVSGGQYDSLPSGWNYFGIVKTSVLKSLAACAILTKGVVNAAAAANVIGAEYPKEAMAALNKIVFLYAGMKKGEDVEAEKTFILGSIRGNGRQSVYGAYVRVPEKDMTEGLPDGISKMYAWSNLREGHYDEMYYTETETLSPLNAAIEDYGTHLWHLDDDGWYDKTGVEFSYADKKVILAVNVACIIVTLNDDGEEHVVAFRNPYYDRFQDVTRYAWYTEVDGSLVLQTETQNPNASSDPSAPDGSTHLFSVNTMSDEYQAVDITAMGMGWITKYIPGASYSYAVRYE